MTKKASIIITVDSEYALINNFFQLFCKSHNTELYEIIVINDACQNHDTIVFLEKLRSDLVIDNLITLTEKVGFGRANNVGIAASTANKIVLLNTDILLVDNEIEKLIVRMNHVKCQAIQPLLLYPQNGRIQSSGHIFGNLFNRHAQENNKADCFEGQIMIQRQALTPAFCILDKNVLDSLGRFDDFYYNSYEALDLTLLFHLNGYKCMVATDIHAYHIREASRSFVYFNEEQQNPYFWSKYSTQIANDYVTCVEKQLNPAMKEKYYFVCNFSHINLLLSLKNINLKISEQVTIQHGGHIELFGILPYNYLTSPYPLLFLCNNFLLLSNNKLWLSLRKRNDDLIIDSSGNVIFLHEI